MLYDSDANLPPPPNLKSSYSEEDAWDPYAEVNASKADVVVPADKLTVSKIQNSSVLVCTEYNSLMISCFYPTPYLDSSAAPISHTRSDYYFVNPARARWVEERKGRKPGCITCTGTRRSDCHTHDRRSRKSPAGEWLRTIHNFLWYSI
jgi:hypothetical protein